MVKRGILLILMFLLAVTEVHGAGGSDEFNPMDYIDKNSIVIKSQVDKLNKEKEIIYKGLFMTKNGVTIFSPETIKEVDRLNQSIVLLEEVMRMRQNGVLHKFRAVSYPLISEIEHYGVKSGYTDALYTDTYFNNKENDEYIETLVDYDYFYEVEFPKFVQAVELIDNITNLDLSGVQILFSPYKILSSYAYCEDYRPTGVDIRRTRVYYNPNEGEDIISTLYHELGHMVYAELVEGNEKNYNLYYDIYKSEFDKNNAVDRYGYWDNKLTENFAEDFKIYVAHKLAELDTELNKFIEERNDSFFGKATKYEVKKETIVYFDNLLEQYKTSKINKGRLRPDISIELKDYKESFNYKDSSYLQQYTNKVITSSSSVKISLTGLEYSTLKVKSIKLREYNNDVTQTKEKSISIDEKTPDIILNLRGKDKIYEVILVLGDVGGKYVEEVVFYFIKE